MSLYVRIFCCKIECQTDITMEIMSEMVAAQESQRTGQWGVEKIKDDDTATKFYTGLPCFAVFLWLFK